MQSSYKKKKKIGEGAYSTIYLAEEYLTSTEQPKIIESFEGELKGLVAIKQIKFNKEIKGIDLSAVREIKALKTLQSDFIIKLHDVFYFDYSVNLVLEYIPITLENIIKSNKIVLMPSDIKSWLIMILKGLNEIHSNYFIHRDLKPNNILFKDGTLKIADFGLTRKITNNNMTSSVVTRWYRAPELLLGCKNYTFSVDIWSLGCIMAELYLRTPFLPGDNDISQLDLIFRALGTPEKEYFKAVNPELSITFKNYSRPVLKQTFTAMRDDGIELMTKMLNLKAVERPSVLKIMKDDYFKNDPLPKTKDCLIKVVPFDVKI